MGHLQGAVIANVLAVVSVGRVHGTAITNFLADVSVGRLQGVVYYGSVCQQPLSFMPAPEPAS